jgi:hypothetical protein
MVGGADVLESLGLGGVLRRVPAPFVPCCTIHKLTAWSSFPDPETVSCV